MSLSTAYALKKRGGGKCMAHGAAGCGECMAKGGEARAPMAAGGMASPEEGIVDRIMARFAGGKPTTDEQPADFDYLDQMPADHEADYTAENSGDEDGDDLVSRAMKRRKQA